MITLFARSIHLITPSDISDQDEDPDGDAGDTDSTVDNRIVVTLTPGEVDEENNFVDAAPPTGTPTGSPTKAPTAAAVVTGSPTSSPTSSPTPMLKGCIKGAVTDDRTGEGLEGATIKLLDSSDNEIMTTSTDANGNYEFTDVPEGTYTVQEMNPPGYPDDVGATEVAVMIDSEACKEGVDFTDGAPTGSPTKAPVAPTNSPTRSPTISNTAAISGTVKNTSNVGLPAAVVELLDSSGNVIETTNPDSNGFYEFVNLEPGDYIVREINPSDYPIDISDQDEDPDGDAGDTDSTVDNRIVVTLTPGEVDEENNFVDAAAPTFAPTLSPVATGSPTASPTATETGTVTGVIYEDTNGNGVKDTEEDGIPNVEVVITDSNGDSQTVTTDSNGEYTAVVPPGVTVIDIDETTLPPDAERTEGTDPTSVDVPSGGTASDIDGFQFPTGAPSRAPVSAGPPGGLEATSSPAPSGSPSESPSRSPAPTTPGTAPPTSSPAPSASPTGSPTGTVTGVVFEDTDGNGMKDPGEDGIPGVEVVITDSNGDPQTVTTDSNGEYTAVVPPGPTVVDVDETTLPDPDSTQTAGTDPTSFDVPPGETVSDFDGFQSPTGTPTGSPTKAPIATGSPTASPTATETGAVTGVVYEDTNGNGVKDPEEDGIPDVEVVITDSNGDPQTVTTDSNGEYSAVVPPGPTVIDVDETTLPPDATQDCRNGPYECGCSFWWNCL